MQKLYDNLIEITENNDSFFFKDFLLDGKVYRIFNYRIASYTDFLLPDAIECRGIMFEVDNDGNMISIKSRPMAKFWNLYENPNTMDLDLSKVKRFMNKSDGSLISSYWHNDNVKLKTKGSLYSDQALAAMDYLNESDNHGLYTFIHNFTKLGYTVNLEWCSPDNRIVLAYEYSHLQILNIRHNQTGEYLDIFEDIVLKPHPVMLKHRVNHEYYDDPVEFLAKIPDMTGIEGYVCEMEDGTLFKIKTLAYLALHHTKDSINSQRRLYEAVLEETTDDLKSMFHDDPVAIKLILDMEKFVEEKLNHVVHIVETCYNNNKHLDRKGFAIKAKAELPNYVFGLAMNLYLDKSFSYKEFMKKQWKLLGLTDGGENDT